METEKYVIWNPYSRKIYVCFLFVLLFDYIITLIYNCPFQQITGILSHMNQLNLVLCKPVYCLVTKQVSPTGSLWFEKPASNHFLDRVLSNST